LENGEGVKLTDFRDVASLGAHYFNSIFKELEDSNLVELLKVIYFLPCLVHDDDN
jgi:hypothetical protein